MTTVEYLSITEKSNTFCDSVSTFNKLLQVDSTLVINGGKIAFKDSFICDYKITSGEIQSKEQRYFHTYFSINGEGEADLVQFLDFLRTVRSILAKIGSQPETLWDDISFYYSRIAYNIIHKIENLMRKLIANFMLTTVGVQWVNETTPPEVKEVISKGKRKDYINVLHNVDFIHLADFLIKPYSNTSPLELNKKIRGAATIEDLGIIKTLLPESNWNRYFSNLVSCEDTFLQRRWSELYELRCKVAHNAIVTRQDFEQISTLAKELEEKLVDALNKLPQVKVPEAEVNNVAESAAENVSSVLGDFISVWRILEQHIDKKSAELGCKPHHTFEAMKTLRQHGVFNREQFAELREVYNIRNHIVHPTDIILSEADIILAIQKILRFIDDLGYIDNDRSQE